MTTNTPQPRPTPTDVVGPRSFLKRLGIGAGAVAVVAGGGLAWRSINQSVLAPGTGPAFEPWRANLDGDPPLSLVSAAILAANAHDTQPWAFAVSPDRIDLFADRSRSIGAMDPVARELILSLGCALENLTLAAGAHGLEAVVSLFPDPDDPDRVAAVELVPAQTDVSPLYLAIPNRHTDRGGYDLAIPVERGRLDEMSGLADEPAVSLAWLTDDAAMSRFGQLTIDATAAIIADPEQARDDFAWYRQDWGQIQRERDGIIIDAAGLPEIMRVLARMLPPLSQASMQQAWVDATRDRHVATAAAYGLVLVRERKDAEQLLLAGRLLQRALLFATTKSLAVQPLNQLLERADREATAEVGHTFGVGMEELTPAGWEMVTAFRIGHSTGTPGISPRRAVSDVVRA